jgi:hypothetical protein
MRFGAGICIIVGGLAAGLAGCQDTTARYPKPTEFAHSEGQNEAARKQYKLDRKAWMEQMHRTAPDVDWRAKDEETHGRKVARRLPARKELKAMGLLSEGAPIIESIDASDAQGRWIERGSNNLAGRMVVCDVDASRQLIYAGSAGGNVWRGNLDGTGWRSLNDFLKIKGIETVRLIPTTQGTRLIASQNSPSAIFYTDDEGLTWDSASGFENAQKWGSLKRTVVTAGDSPVIYVLLEEWDYGPAWRSIISIYKSVNQGTSFARIRTFTGQPKKVFDLWAPRFGGTGLPYLISGASVYQFDAADNLTPIGTVGVDFTVGDNSHSNTNLSGLVTGGTTTWLYAMFVVSDKSRVYRSGDGGRTWQYRGTADTGPFFEVNSFTSSSKNSDRVYVGGVEAFRSYDGGISWTRVNGWGEYYGNPAHKLHADIPAIQPFRDTDGSEFQLVSTDGGTYISRDALTTVNNLSLQELRISQYYTTFTHRTQPWIVYAGSQDQGFQRTLATQPTPGGVLNFEQTISGDYGHIVSSDNGDSIWTVYPGFAMYYPNARTSTANLTWNFTGMSGQLWMPPLMADPENPTHVYLGGGTKTTGAHLWHLRVEGSSIVAEELPFDFSNGVSGRKVSAMACSPIQPLDRYVMTDNGDFFWSRDGGTTWTRTASFDGPDSHYFYGSVIKPSPVNAGEVFIAGSGYSNPPVYRTTDYGKTFTAYNQEMPGTLVYDMAITPDGSALFAATEVGPYIRYIDQGNWVDLAGVSGPDQTYWSVDYIPAIRIARFGTYGRGIWDYQFVQPIIGDFEPDGDIDLQDFAQLARAWQTKAGQANWNAACDISGPADGVIDLSDLLAFARSWQTDPAMKGYWNLDETGGAVAADSAFYPHDGTLMNMDDEAWVPGQSGHALQFDGATDFVMMPAYKGIPGTKARTCMAWIKTTGTLAPIVYWGDKTTTGGIWEMRVNSSGQLRVQMNGLGVNGITPVNTGQWVHVAAMLPAGGNNSDDVLLYVNGALETGGTLVAGTINTVAAATMRIGANETGNYFAGLIDEVRIYDRALTVSELRRIAGLFMADAGADRTVACRIGETNISVQLEGKIVNGTGAETVTWSKVSGPGTLAFVDSTALNTHAIFSMPGKYILRLIVTEGRQVSQDETVVYLSTGEVGYWGMDGDYSDFVNGNTGTPQGDPAFVGADQAKVGSGAVELDGNDSVVMNGFAGITGTRARTTMAWIKTTGIVAPIVYWGDKNTTGALWDMRVSSTGRLRLLAGGGPVVDGVTVVNTGQWVHVAAVLPEGGNNADDVLLYVNGVLETGGAVTAGAINTKAAAAFRLGTDETGKYFTGLIDDVRIYDRALTAEEITAVMGK